MAPNMSDVFDKPRSQATHESLQAKKRREEEKSDKELAKKHTPAVKAENTAQ